MYIYIYIHLYPLLYFYTKPKPINISPLSPHTHRKYHLDLPESNQLLRPFLINIHTYICTHIFHASIYLECIYSIYIYSQSHMYVQYIIHTSIPTYSYIHPPIQPPPTPHTTKKKQKFQSQPTLCNRMCSIEEDEGG